MIRRPPRSTLDRSSAASDVYKRQGQAPSVATSYDPEQLDAYEIGLKTELLGRRVVFNTDAFYYDYKNIQFQRVQTGVVLTLNGPSAETYGAEATVEALATDNLTLRASASYLH